MMVTLYALNNEPVAMADTKSGIVCFLNPTYSAPTFETVLSGFEDGVTLNKMSSYGNQLSAVDTKQIFVNKIYR